ncbi:MAG: hypothetical protein DRP45_06485 [Candidatus Zixiibacteriota bacterium]|nr:MAG: hypothetical protein DRP45_06485 [candidate division Zixibacteria bacterium]
MAIKSKRQLRALAALNLDLFEAEPLGVPAPATLYTKISEEAGQVTAAVASTEDARLSSDGPELPSEEDLYSLFDRYNWMYFDGRLSRPIIEYSTRMTSAGAYLPYKRLIRIGRKYHQIFPEEISDTLKHEMIHLLHLNHSASFRAEAKRVGASIKARSHPSLRKPPRYVYVCENCGTEYPRQKRLIMASCGSCSPNGKYDGRFKLKLKRSLRQPDRVNRR